MDYFCHHVLLRLIFLAYHHKQNMFVQKVMDTSALTSSYFECDHTEKCVKMQRTIHALKTVQQPSVERQKHHSHKEQTNRDIAGVA